MTEGKWFHYKKKPQQNIIQIKFCNDLKYTQFI